MKSGKQKVESGNQPVANAADLLREEFKANEEAIEELLRECRKRGWIRTAEQERIAGQILFNRMAVRKRDPKMWSMVQQTNLSKDKVDLARKKLRLELRKYNDKKPTEKQGDYSDLTAEQKEGAIRKIYGMS